jgi:hypothetical protein
MNASQGSSRLRTAAAIAAAAACLTLLSTLDGSRAVGASARADGIACTLVPAGTLKTMLTLSNAQAIRNYDPTTAASHAVHTECGLGLWSGAPPTSPTAVAQALRSGHAAQIGIETWAPHNATAWHADFPKLIAEFKKDGADMPGIFTNAGWPSKPFKPSALGHTRVGVTIAMHKTFQGVLTAVACWWETKTESAICLLDEEAASRPVVKHLDKIAAIVVPKFLG